jgi:hypothetical protein
MTIFLTKKEVKMPKFEVEYAITGYGTVTVYADNEEQAYSEFSCNSMKDLLHGLPWEEPDVVGIIEVASDEDDDDEDEEG